MERKRRERVREVEIDRVTLGSLPLTRTLTRFRHDTTERVQLMPVGCLNSTKRVAARLTQVD
jgi:hypothetical protein